MSWNVHISVYACVCFFVCVCVAANPVVDSHSTHLCMRAYMCTCVCLFVCIVPSLAPPPTSSTCMHVLPLREWRGLSRASCVCVCACCFVIGVLLCALTEITHGFRLLVAF
eukprot:GDKI01042486.1.p2 GENE.GDKI01042486.1~~GDKI01042486.1.p2  ORF type:complete len:111 (-),score=19.97 GDKI01042486.1:327-659(-)